MTMMGARGLQTGPGGAGHRRTGAATLRGLARIVLQVILIAVLLLPIGGILFAVALDRHATRTGEVAVAIELLGASERNTRRALNEATSVLAALDSRMAQIDPDDRTEVHATLERWRASMGHYLGLASIGPDLRIRSTSGTIPGAVIEQASLAAAALEAGTSPFHIQPADMMTAEPVILVFRRAHRLSGLPDGMLMAVIDPKPLQDFFRVLGLGPQGAVFVLDHNGDAILSASHGTETTSPPPVWRDQAITERDNRLTVLPPTPDKNDRIAVARPLEDGAPFVVLVVRDAAPAFAAARTRAMAVASLGGFPLLVAFGLAVAAFQQARRLNLQNRQLADQAGTLSATLESVEDAIVAFAPDGRITLANRAAARLLRPDEGAVPAGQAEVPEETGSRLPGHRLPDFPLRWRTVADADSPDPRADRDGAELIEDLVRRACAGERIGPLELAAFSTRRAEPIRLLATLRMIPGLEGATAGAVLVLQDRTGERAIEERLRQSEKMQAIGQLTGGVAHDFNNLLLVILGGAEELAARLVRDPPGRRTAALIVQAAERGAALTRRLLAFARRQPLVPRLVDVAVLLREALPLLTRTASPSVPVTVRAEAGLWATRIDPEQLVVALVNLVANARDAMPDGGSLRIEIANETLGARERDRGDGAVGDYVAIRVQDTGTGMTADVRARAIEPFFSTKGPGAGTGLGLSMVHGFVHQSGGRMRIESQPGAGTRVSLLLPRAPGAPLAEGADDPCPTGSERILLTGSDPATARQTADLLAGLGYPVTLASGPDDALEHIAAGPPFDLLVAAAEPAGGLEFVRLARERQPDLGVLLITAAAAGDGQETTIAGSVIRIARPRQREDLAHPVRQALDARP